MNPIRVLTSISLLTAPSLVLAHGSHAQLPAEGLLHLLAHHWPLLLIGFAVVAVPLLIKRSGK